MVETNNSPTPSELRKYAASDIRAARKNGTLLVGQTKRGTIELARCEGRGMVAVDGAPMTIKAAQTLLAAAYVVEGGC